MDRIFNSSITHGHAKSFESLRFGDVTNGHLDHFTSEKKTPTVIISYLGTNLYIPAFTGSTYLKSTTGPKEMIFHRNRTILDSGYLREARRTIGINKYAEFVLVNEISLPRMQVIQVQNSGKL
jgi:hypothetical protein